MIPITTLSRALRNCLLILCLGLSFVSADDERFQALALELTTVKLAQTQPVLEKIAETEHPVLLQLFQTMVEGDLYYHDETLELLSVERIDGEYVIKNLLSGEVLPIDRDITTKIRVNNRLRVWLRGAIAQIQLTADDASARLAAVRSLLERYDDDSIELLLSLRADEPNTKVRSAMDTVLAMNTAENSADTGARVASIERLSDSLEPDVRNLLVELSYETDAPVVAAEAQRALERIEGRVNFFGHVDTLFFGLSLGSVLLLASIGLAITFGVMGVINMAHGEMIMLGAYTTYVVQLLMPNHIDASLWVAIPAAFLVSGAFGVLIERGVIQFLHGRPLETLLATFGISLILQQLVRTIFSPLNRQVDTPSWMSGQFEINPVLFVTLNRFYIFVFALLVFAALVLVLSKTNLGLHVRAVSQNRQMAKAMGIRTARVDALTFGLGSGIAGIAGVALSQLTNVGPNLGQSYIIDSFMVVVFGGVGNLFGTLVAAFTLGIANKVFEPVTGAVLASILVLVFIILFIQKRPKGLFPQKGRAAE
ncbi:urea ABC transporter permease subunit UrtB [Reinekea blandensis]|uniref:Branched-chain amino acid ABC-type transport system, permease component n=1 Tax=Reinekea blandensis MED297 TaxID=314283 RepID=A4BBQ3_9GAMM|nr:urea ABC transporter permease subunit UrtB [Reinekea blandensis]EAR10388.1 Branched-chain amino acid ABC-type transport system, permease component [Reinekea sp. MED297] [Reinekea blandensis MED297]